MLRLFINLLVNGLFIYLSAELLDGVWVKNYWVAIGVGLVLGIVNTLIKPIITLLTLPITLITLGLFLIIINGGMVLLADWFIEGFAVNGWLWAIIFSLFLAVLNGLFGNTRRERVISND